MNKVGGRLSCLNLEDGSVIWEKTTEHIETWPAMYKSNLYIGTGYFSFGDSAGYLYCLDPENGAEKWNYQFDHYMEAGQAIYRGKIYFVDWLGNAYCIDAETGKELWVSSGFGQISHSSPALSKGRLYFGGGYDKKIHCLNADTGEEVWSVETGGNVDSDPAVDGDKVYISSIDGNVYCLDAGTGKGLWKYQTYGNIWNEGLYFSSTSSPIVVQVKLYVGAWDHHFYCLNKETGEKVWSFDAGEKVKKSAFHQGRIFFAAAGKIFSINAGSEEVGDWPMFQKNLYRTGCTSVISGQIADNDGNPLADVELVVTKVGTSSPLVTTNSNDRRYYEFADLSDGTYTVTASAEGYTKLSEEAFLDPLAPIDDLDFILEPSICAITFALGEDSNNDDLPTLRKLRDEVLSNTPAGQEMIRLYYQLSPAIIKIMEKKDEFKKEVKRLIDAVLQLL